jgi:dimeric dUTPase (all-alpha-NTP-PPase superfamily)
MERQDSLVEIFRLQKELNQRVGVQTDDMDDAARQEWILNYCRAMSQEIAELTDSVPWKWWAKYQKFDKQNVRVEIIDMFHFLISLAQVAEMSAQDVFEAYTRKHAVNIARQEAGYAVKDERDNSNI